MSMQCIVLGFHRSGTSAITQNLSNSGLFIGKQLLGATHSNPHGHFEDAEIVQLHEDILSYNRESWNSPYINTLAYNHGHFDIGRKLVSSRELEYGTWGFKDPRACLFLDYWSIILPQPYYVICLRHYQSCIDSMMRRSFIDMSREINRKVATLKMFAGMDPDSICLSWFNYMERVLEFIQKNPGNTLVMDIAELNGEHSISATLNSKFGFKLKPLRLDETFDANLFRMEPDVDVEISPDVRAISDRLWDDLCKCKLDPDIIPS